MDEREVGNESHLLTGDDGTSSETFFPCTALFRIWMKPRNSA